MGGRHQPRGPNRLGSLRLARALARMHPAPPCRAMYQKRTKGLYLGNGAVNVM